jgi:hypothetical protein
VSTKAGELHFGEETLLEGVLVAGIGLDHTQLHGHVLGARLQPLHGRLERRCGERGLELVLRAHGQPRQVG